MRNGRNKRSERSKIPAYQSWAHMKQRILNPNMHAFHCYAGRGLDMDPRWAKWEAFLSDMGERPKGTTLERLDNNRGYWPDNCYWATPKQQGRNRSTNLFVEVGGRVITASEVAETVALSKSCIVRRIRAGLSGEALCSPLPRTSKGSGDMYTKDGVTQNLMDWARALGFHPRSLYKRRKMGLTGEELLAPSRRKQDGI